ncbi:MAG TPA: hypothetical protein VEY93_05610 [Longimicrobium sp.]|nr:hypothetical protein [Longimicrobium sp.]
MYDIFSVPTDAAEAAEQMGTKRKFWFRHPDLGWCLFKLARPETGEDWSEKVACEIAGVFELPHARYEMAEWSGQPGSMSVSMLAGLETLIHGNELIAQLTTLYPAPEAAPRYRNSGHTLSLVMRTIERSGAEPPIEAALPAGVQTAGDVFVGYLLLDALIGNTDRHHENWAVVERYGLEAEFVVSSLYLSPTYDHASSLGRNEPDARREERLRTTDKGNSVEAYADRCASALYLDVNERKPLRTFDAFRHASALRPEAAEAWLARLRAVDETVLVDLLAHVPQERCSAVAKEFATRMVLHNRARLLTVED